MDNRIKNALYSLALAVAITSVYFFRDNPKEIYLQGRTMGSIAYHIRYISTLELALKAEVDSLLTDFNQVMSTYIPESDLNFFNRSVRGIALESSFFFPLLQEIDHVHRLSGGAFDPTVMPLINYWGFGPQKHKPLKDSLPPNLLTYVGWQYIDYNSDSLLKKHPKVELDFSAIAKGYAVDLVTKLLDKYNIEHYMVEIGGEVRCKGKNIQNHIWRIGIEQPAPNNIDRTIAHRIALENRALATSGTYRNFYTINQKKYVHTIDPKNGYPVEHNLVSVSVFAPTCMTADALATAIMVLGETKGQKLIEANPNWEAIFITADKGKLQTTFTAGITAL